MTAAAREVSKLFLCMPKQYPGDPKIEKFRFQDAILKESSFSMRKDIPFTPKFVQINSPRGFFFVFVFVIFTGIRCSTDFFL